MTQQERENIANLAIQPFIGQPITVSLIKELEVIVKQALTAAGEEVFNVSLIPHNGTTYFKIEYVVLIRG